MVGLALAAVSPLPVAVTGCSGGGGGGDGTTAPGGSPPPATNQAPEITKPVATPNPATEGSGGTVVITATATDPEHKPVTVTWSQTGGSPVTWTTSVSGSVFSMMLQVPTEGTYTFVADAADAGGGHKKSDPVELIVNPASTSGGGGGGGGSTPTAPQITAFSTESGLPVEVDKPVQTGWVNTTLTGYSESQVTVKVNDNGTRYDGSVLRFRAIDGVEVELPELSTAGQKTLELHFAGIAAPATFAVQYQPTSVSTFITNRDAEYFNGGSYAVSSISAVGSANAPYESGQINGHFNAAGFTRTERAGEFFAGCMSSGSNSVQIFLYRDGSQSGPLQLTTGAFNDQGYVHSIASTPDGRQCAVLWSDRSDSQGRGAIGYLTVVDSNLSPAPFRPLSNVTGVSMGYSTPVQVVTLGINGMGNDEFQPYAVWATHYTSEPYKLFMTPLTTNPVPMALKAYEFALDVRPQVLVFGRDRNMYCVDAIAVGRHPVTGDVESQGIDFLRTGVRVGTKRFLFNSSREVFGAEFHVELIGNPPTPHYILSVATQDIRYRRCDLSLSVGSADTKSFSGPTVVARHFATIPGVGFTVAASGGGISELHISKFGDFDNPTVYVTTDETHTLGVCSRDVVWISVRQDKIRTYRGPTYAERTLSFTTTSTFTPASFFRADR
ncbi:MAG: hypothetical protein HY461_00700 [Parcubacteria group bacterium]|nr:hypothetical protein [Parcubacteria group bacterium]